MQQLDDAATILQAAEAVEVPAVMEEEADLPFTEQRYLPRESEDKLAQVVRWQRPQISDRALALFFARIEEQLRRKQKAVARLQSTIRYSEENSTRMGRQGQSNIGRGRQGQVRRPKVAPTPKALPWRLHPQLKQVIHHSRRTIQISLRPMRGGSRRKPDCRSLKAILSALRLVTETAR